MLAIVFALFAASANAAGSVLQRLAARAVPPQDRLGLRLIALLVRRRAWLGGIGLLVCAGGLQALALYRGGLALVQPIAVAELPLALVLSGRVFRGALGRRAWLGILAMSGGLVLVLFALDPSNPGPGSPDSQGRPTAWLAAAAGVGAAMLAQVLPAASWLAPGAPGPSPGTVRPRRRRRGRAHLRRRPGPREHAPVRGGAGETGRAGHLLLRRRAGHPISRGGARGRRRRAPARSAQLVAPQPAAPAGRGPQAAATGPGPGRGARGGGAGESLWYRPPYGVLSGEGLLAARLLGLRPVLWSSWAKDWTADATPARVLGTVRPGLVGGATILLHDTDAFAQPGSWRATLGALPQIVARCRDQGLRVGSLGAGA